MMLNVIVVNIFAQEKTIASIDVDVLNKMRSDNYVCSSSARTTCDFSLLTGITYKKYIMRTIDFLNNDTTHVRLDIMIKDYEWLNLKFNNESYLNFVFINKRTNEKVNIKVKFAENIKLEECDVEVPNDFKVISFAFLMNDESKMMVHIDDKYYNCCVESISFYDNFQFFEYIDDVIFDVK